MENDKVHPGTLNIIEDRIERTTRLRTAMDKWKRPEGDKHLLAYLKQLKRQFTNMIKLLNLIHWALVNIELEPPMLDEILSLNQDEWRLVNRYLFGLKKYFKERAVAG